MPDSDTGLIY
ncbi:uncharacterized protein FFM5_13741 [Fusarium fujikuroi]|nr:uncharacterized protein FFM5_13741 [Fusarium fujikuroi]